MRRLSTLMVSALMLTALAASAASAQVDEDPSTLEPPAGEETEPTPTKAYRQVVADAIDDLQNYWESEFPDAYGEDYEAIPEDDIYPLTPDTPPFQCEAPDGPFAGRTFDVAYAENAFWSNACNLMAYDDEVYLPSKYERFGPYGPAITLAHEWGHAMQDAAGLNTPPVEEWPPSVLLELQADCFAGAFTGYVLDGDARLELTGGDLDQALAARLTAGDPPGVPSTHQQAHGSGFDRVGAFQEGFDLGATQCVGFVEDDPPRVTEIPFIEGQDAENEGNLPGDVVLGVTVDVLNDFYSQVEPAYEPIALEDLVEYDSTGPASDLPECGGSQLEKKQVSNRLIFCGDDGYIGYDLPFLQQVYSNIGDFGVAALMSNVFATYVQTLQEFPGVEDNAENAVLGADCYSGAFAGAMIAEEDGTGGLISTSADPTGEEQVITLSSGDLDEMIYAFIENDRIRGVDKTADFTFRRVSVLRRGVLRGFESCAEFAEE